MKVKQIREAIQGLHEDEEVMITFYLKSHGDEVAEENGEQILTDGEWEDAVDEYTANDLVDQVATEGFQHSIWKVLKKRD